MQVCATYIIYYLSSVFSSKSQALTQKSCNPIFDDRGRSLQTIDASLSLLIEIALPASRIGPSLSKMVAEECLFQVKFAFEELFAKLRYNIHIQIVNHFHQHSPHFSLLKNGLELSIVSKTFPRKE